MTDKELAEIRGRLAAATPGPWKWEYGQLVSKNDEVMDEPGINKPSDPDAIFIANAPADIAALLAEIESLRKDMIQY